VGVLLVVIKGEYELKTALICFEGGNEYTKEKQIRAILKEENEQFGICCKDYGELDAIMPILKEQGIQKAIILHEDRNLDRFEIAARQEYSFLKELEILPEGFIRLKEAGGLTGQATPGQAAQAGKQGTSVATRGSQLQQKQQNPGTANFSKIIIYGPNPLLEGTKDVGIVPADDILIISILSLQPAKTGLWNFTAPTNAALKKMKEIKDYATGRTIEGVLRLFEIQPQNAPQNIIAYTGAGTENFLTNDQTLRGKIQPMGNLNQAAAITAFKLGAEISQGKAKPDTSKCEEWETKRLPLLGFLIKELGDIQHAMTVGDKEEATKDGHSLANQILETFGFYKDVATLAKNMRTGGMALLVDAAEIISKEAGKKKERKEKKSDSLVSHPKFEEFAGFFTKNIDDMSGFIEA
jgi:hypothetical protein